MMAPDWPKIAACRGMDTDLFFVESTNEAIANGVKATCASCPVQLYCLLQGYGEHYGVWGGATTKERLRHRQPLALIEKVRKQTQPARRYSDAAHASTG